MLSEFSPLLHVLLPTPLGPVGLTASADGLHRVCVSPTTPPFVGLLTQEWVRDSLNLNPDARDHLLMAYQWCNELFALFTDHVGGDPPLPPALRLAPKGTPFQREVWRAIRQIPRGGVSSYGDIAASIGKPKASRAVGMACGANPLLLVVPCHRVIAASGHLGGFSAGVHLKKALLMREGRKIRR